MKTNNAAAVKKLQQFLNDNTNVTPKLVVDGIFGEKTEAAVKAFQLAHKKTVLDPWHLSGPTGIFYLTTQTELNNIFCPDLELPVPTNLIPYEQNPATPKT